MGGGRTAAAERPPDRGLVVRLALVALVLGLATVTAVALVQVGGLEDASAVYLVAVVMAAGLMGTGAAVATSFVSFLLYDFLLTAPRFTLSVSGPQEWLSLLLFLIVAVVIGRLVALQRDRAEEANRRVREGVALVAMSRDVAVAVTFEAAAAAIAVRLQEDAEMRAVWVESAGAPGRAVAWTGDGPPAAIGVPWTLVRSPDGGSDWIRLHERESAAAADDIRAVHYLVPIEDGGQPAGAIHATRLPDDPRPGRGARRLLTLAADQLAIAHRRDALRAELTAAELERQSESLRGAILDAVSHDLRTPVASIRVLAGGLAESAGGAEAGSVRAAAELIDAEARTLAELVGGLLDMGRIQSGAVRPDLQPYDLAELVEAALRRHPDGLAEHPLELSVPDGLPPVMADAMLASVALGNVVANAIAHTPPGTPVRISARPAGTDWVLLAVDDAGPGVPDDELPRLFERFYRARSEQGGSRHGMGLGLPIARGFLGAMGATIAAQRSDLGGLGIRIRLPVAPGGIVA